MVEGDGIGREDESHRSVGGERDGVAKEEALDDGDAHGGEGFEEGEDGDGDVAQGAGIGKDEGGEEGARHQELAQQAAVEERAVRGDGREVDQQLERDEDALDAEQGPREVQTGFGEDGLVRQGQQGGARRIREAGEDGLRRERARRETHGGARRGSAERRRGNEM